MKLHDRCRGRWIEIWTQVFGINPKVLDGKHHPCPGCGGVDRFRVNMKRIEHGVWFCGGEARGGVDLCMHVTGLGFRQVAEKIEELVGKSDRPRGRRELSLAELAMEEARPLTKSTYLASRGITEIPSGLFGIASLEYRDGKDVLGVYPAILAPLKRNGKIVTVQATYLERGRKAPVPVPKKTLPGRYETINGAAVQLGDWRRGQVLGFAEGVETAISAAILHGHPVWATLSTSGMKSVEWPSTLERAIIYADNDKSLAGHAAAWHLAHRMAVKGVAVEVVFPEQPGTDWNDVLMQRKER